MERGKGRQLLRLNRKQSRKTLTLISPDTNKEWKPHPSSPAYSPKTGSKPSCFAVACSSVLGISESNVGVKLNRAKKALAALMNAAHAEGEPDESR